VRVSGRRILLVDDENAVRFGFGEYLRDQGYLVECAQDLDDARDRLAATAFDLIITDLRLGCAGSTAGLEVVASARRARPGIRVVVLTACDTDQASEAYRRGADQFLQKPQSLASVANLVEGLLHDLP
jgi:DNA-binding NtrC family response regulator